jgi:hypothetical protein
MAADSSVKRKRDMHCPPQQNQTARNKDLLAEEEEKDEDSRILEAPEPFYEVSISLQTFHHIRERSCRTHWRRQRRNSGSILHYLHAQQTLTNHGRKRYQK